MKINEVRILIAGKPTYSASDLSISIFDFFSKNKINFRIKHAFNTTEIFQSMEKEWDLVLVDKNLKVANSIVEAFFVF